jgi:LacI family transcriptional regulator
VCHGDVLARNVILAACERGLRVPADLSVVSCGPTTIAHHYYPRLATIELDYGAMAGQAMSVWRDLVEDRAVPRACRWVAPRLIEGDTLGHAPRTPKTRARAAG